MKKRKLIIATSFVTFGIVLAISWQQTARSAKKNYQIDQQVKKLVDEKLQKLAPSIKDQAED